MNSPAFFDDSHVENIKNLETYDFSMLATIPAAAHASRRNRVIIPDDDGHLREFIILETAQRDKKKKIKTVASYIELKKSKRISPVVLESQTVNMGLDWTLAGTGWQRGITEYAGIRKVTIDGYKDPYQMLKQLASLFELELRFRIVVDGSRIVGRYVDMIKRRGEDTKKETRLGKDLIGVERIENSDIVTALRVLGPELEDGSRLVVEVKNEEARQRWARNGEHLWEDYEPAISEDNVTVERLTELGEAQLAKRINTTVQYTADVVSMEEIFGYTHEKVRLGDTNRIKDTSYSPPLYLEARVIEIHRSISAGKVKRKYVLGDFIEYAEEDLMKTFLQLQQIYGAKVIRSDTPPPIPKAGMLWVDTSGERDVIYTWNAASQQWDKATPTFAEEVGAYDKETVDSKDQSVYDDSTSYTDIVAEEKKQQAIGESKSYTNAELEAKRLALEASMDVIRNDLLAVEQQAQESITQIITVQDQSILDISNLQTRADNLLSLAEANQADLLQANGKIVTVEQNINTLEGSMVITIDQLTSIDGIVTQQQTTIENHAGLISEKASQTTVNTLTGRVTTVEGSYQTLAGQVTLKANSADVYTKSQMNTELGKKVDTTIYSNKISQLDVSILGITNRVSDTEVSINDLNGEILSTQQSVANVEIKANGIISDVSSLTQTVTNQGNQITSANSNISQLSDQIMQRVTKTEFDALSIGGRNLIVHKNLSSIGTIDKSTYIKNGYIKISAVGTSDGARVAIPNIKPNSKYVLSYSYRKISGTLVAFGGHTDGSFFNNYVVVDGIKRGINYSQGSSVFTADDTEIHKVEVHIQTGTSVTPTHLIYIQPNRGVETSAVVDIFDLVFVEGNRATDWTPAPEDVDSNIQSVSQYASEIDQKADGIISSVSELSQTVTSQGTQITSANSSISQLSDRIDQRVTKTEFEALSIGGKNLLKSSYLNTSSTSYNIARIDLTEPLQEGTQVTLSIKGQLGADRVHWGIYNSGGTINMPSISVRDANGVYKNTFSWRVSGSTNTQLFIYHMNSSSTASSYIEWVKLEKGNKATDWTPAHEDIQGQIDGQAVRITTAETSIQQQAELITQKASQTSVDTLTGRVSSAESTISQHASSIQARVTKGDMNSWFLRLPVTTSSHKKITMMDGSNLDTDFSYELQARTIGTGTNSLLIAYINGNGSSFSIDKAYSQGSGSNHPDIYIHTDGQVYLRTYHTTTYNVDVTITRYKGSRTSFNILSDGINTRVEKNGVISAINQSAESIKLLANKIELDGYVEAKHIKSLNGLNINDQFVVASNGLVTMRGHLDGATGTFSGAVVGGSFERTSTSTGNRTIINENGIFVQYINSSATTVEQVSLQGNSVTWLNNTGSSVLATMRYSLNSLRINSSIVAIDGSLTTDQINTSDYLWVRRNSLNSAAYFTNQNSGRIAEFRSGAGDGSTKAYFENDGTLVTNRVRGLSSGNTIHIGTSGAVSFESKETEQHAFLKMGTVALKGLNGSSERFQIRNAADTSYSLLQLGTLQYQSMSQFSRREYKKNISDVYINPISLLNELTFQDFHYKEQSDFDRKHLGLILDEINPYFHDATGDGLDTLRLLHVNTMAIQELDKRDNEQHLEIEALKKQVAAQQQRIIALENQIAS